MFKILDVFKGLIKKFNQCWCSFAVQILASVCDSTEMLKILLKSQSVDIYLVVFGNNYGSLAEWFI